MRSKIHIHIRNNDNATKGSFVFEYKSELDLDETMKRLMPMLLARGIGVCEVMEYDFTLHGIAFEKGAKLKI